MKDLALQALDRAARRGVTYADVRAIESREREITTKNGKAGHVSSSESQGIGIRILAFGCWGFAATDDLTPAGLDAAAGLAFEIARSGVAARKQEISLAPESAYVADWVSTAAIDPFAIPVDRNLAVLLAVDEELRREAGVNLAETSMHFERHRQVFASTAGQRHRPDAHALGRRILRPELQGRRDPEALLSQLVRGPVPTEGLRAGR